MLRLTAPGVPDLTLDSAFGWKVRGLDLGDPETRVVAEPATDADGTIDTTELIGARSVTVSLRLIPSDLTLPAMVNRLMQFMSPRLRPVVFITEDGDEKRITLRRGQVFAPISTPTHRDVTLSFIAPFGILESAELHEASAFPSGEGAELGRDYDLTFDRTYPTSPVLGSRTVVNAGTIDAYPVLRIFGPVGAAPGADPQGPDTTTIRNLTTGKNLVFEDLVVAAGDYCEIDTRRKTIRINGLPEQSRYDRLKFPDSRWWTLVPGENELRFSPETSSGVAELRILWRSAWL